MFIVFCTTWPSAMKEKPIKIISNNYLYSGPSIRHPESRKVTLKVSITTVVPEKVVLIVVVVL